MLNRITLAAALLLAPAPAFATPPPMTMPSTPGPTAEPSSSNPQPPAATGAPSPAAQPSSAPPEKVAPQ